ncbi:MAG: hypothetical protein OQK24_02070 [Magnetovibrio sp.]|nr:hypothetical protein [Magnetovibrio sp.]
MTDATLAHAFPDLTDKQALMAQLAEALEFARYLEMTQKGLQSRTGGELQEFIDSAGLPEEIEAAGKTVRASMLEILNRVNEEDLKQARYAGLLTPDNFTDGLKAKHTMILSRGRLSEREEEREA